MDSTAPRTDSKPLDGVLRWLATAALLLLARGVGALVGARDSGLYEPERAPWVALEAVLPAWWLAAGLAVLVVAFASRARRRGLALVVLAALAGAASLRVLPVAALPAPPAFATGAAAGVAALLALLAVGRGARAAAPLYLAAVIAAALALPRVAPRLEAHWIAHDVLVDEDAWTVVEERADAPVAVASITPSVDSARARDDVPSVVMPPPATVEFVVPPTDEPLLFRSRAGIARRVRAEEGEATGRDLGALLPKGDVVRVRFQLEVDGELLFDEVSEWKDDRSATWANATGDDGLMLRAGQVVRLRTLPVEGSAEVDAIVQPGFTRLQLERAETHRARLATPDRPNIVYVVMDTLRADRTTVGGAQRDLTPHLARLAERGTTYTHAYATSSWTWPSTASLLTGMQPHRHGVLSSMQSYLDSRIDTLAELLQARGYATAAIIGNPLIVEAQNFDQGFQHFRSTASGVFIDSDVLVPEAIEWLRETAPARCFLYLHLVDPHEPHDPTPEAWEAVEAGEMPHDYPKQGLTSFKFQLNRRRKDAQPGDPIDTSWIGPQHRAWMQTSYDAAVWTGDWWLGKLLDELDALGMRENTIVVFTSDHGEELLDHGHVEHIHSLWSELVRVPLVIAGPGVPAGVRVETPVANRHLMPTLAKAGDAYPRQLDRFFDLREPDAVQPSKVWFSTESGIWGVQSVGSLYGVRDGDHVLHYAPDAIAVDVPERRGDWRLFDLAADPLEKDDLSREQDALARALREEILANLAEQVERRFGGHIVSGQATLEMLRAIGYVGEDE